MSAIPWFILMLVVLLGTVGQLSLKYAFQDSQSASKNTSSFQNLLLSRFFWFWFGCYVVVTILWLLVLRSLPLSQAFPALGLTFALVPIASHYYLHEKVVFSQWLGIIIIVFGTILVVQK
jgi:undecaprenyl phosphate-alpha-L-ara4N flippase subunit ArnE